MDGFYRPVQYLSVVQEKIVTFVNDLGELKDPIDPHRLILPW
ncbi:hypothetical protein [Burkholderia cepacia]|nr:hypothetical protein [Burkholderia cepacia]